MTTRDTQLEILENLTDLFNRIRTYYQPQMMAEFAEDGVTNSELEVIELIAADDFPNVTKLAEKLYITRGAVSKITKKLIEKKLIASFQRAENKKEIYFELTDRGLAINERHQALHERFLDEEHELFAQLSAAEVADVLTFLGKYNQHLDKKLREKLSGN